MNYRMIVYLLGIILAVESALLLLPMLVAVIFGESVLPFLITALIGAAIAVPAVIFKPENKRIFIKEGFITVALTWVIMSLIGALPYVFSGAIPNYIDAVFETVSGFTTTGATVISDVESLGFGILFWRAFTHWIGGMGILVFVLAVLPMTGGQTIHLMRAEVPGPTKSKLVPKMRQTSTILYGIYMVLTVIQTVALIIAGLPVYDSIVTAFSTAGTGGFSVLNASVSGYSNVAAEWIIAIFMFLFGVNFNVYFFIIIGNLKDAFKSEELWAYIGICTVSSAIIATNTARMFSGIGDAIRNAVFNVTSFITTTGFVTVEFNNWPAASKTVLILLMLSGACAGSTAGGLKVSRVVILFKSAIREIRHILRPKSVNTVRLDGEAVPDESVRSANVYLVVYVGIIALSTLLASFDRYSLETSITAVISMVNNVGPVFGDIGGFGNMSGFSYFSKIVFIFDMLIGRLEIWPMLILLSPRTYKRG